jgi:hypothetical protein
MLLNSRPRSRKLSLAVVAFLLSLAATATLRAQSSEANYPTPIFTSELSGRIAPRDVGDPRRTRHFYIFRGTEGDVVVNLETTEMLGDVDVFLATGFRPLVKFTLFGDPARLSKSFYLRKEETLVLRVEARAVGDIEGTYRITFGGSFLTAPPELANQPQSEAPTLSSNESRGTRRVTATGARIEEPRIEPTPAEETATVEPIPAPTPERTTGRRPTTRRGRGTRPAPTRSRPNESAAQPTPTQPESSETKPAEETTAGTTTPAETPTPTPPARRRGTRTTRRGSARESAGASRAEPTTQPPTDTQPETAATPPEPAPTQRLIIISKDGELFERDMGSVRRVTVENNQVVIVGRDGKVTRRPLANILKMSIEPF